MQKANSLPFTHQPRLEGFVPEDGSFFTIVEANSPPLLSNKKRVGVF
jgi:hypothetical protein